MLDIQQKRKLRYFVYHRATLGILLLIVLLISHSTWSVYKKKKESETLMNLSKSKLIELQTRNLDLEEKIKRLDTEVGLEEEIRLRFSVAREGESMVIILPDDTKPTTTPVKKTGFWNKIMRFF